ncbi:MULTISPECIES: EboA domain-containing protein [Flavobacteriaceae]|uniref:EboA domain-containing protein n=1 Tax=Flavobacteriaceae TaxID=49546 RepID=UPI0010ADF6EE|nr:MULTISPECIES: EboA domain-containing protein [Flavobacteriaceae]NJB35033.1 hypothetical protein [Croceivirga sp. JEA036]TKD63430.1 hypothetical protein FBT53_08785 [Flavobacterium sp. ASW18X]
MTTEVYTTLLKKCLSTEEYNWLQTAIAEVVATQNKQKLYIAYSLCATKIHAETVKEYDIFPGDKASWLSSQEINFLELSRIVLLRSILEAEPKMEGAVQKLIQVADITELETFLKFLVLLPKPENYKFVAVEALRTNIATVFNAISQNNPYPSAYFTSAEYNQMYLKSAFMQQDLTKIIGVDEMANADLARIISDYAHERWAASRTIDPAFWRPVSNFLDGTLIDDIERLFKSKDAKERRAATLVCYHSKKKAAQQLLQINIEYLEEAKNGTLTWQNL